MLIALIDPYGRGRDLTVDVDVAARAALAECRQAGHRGRWQFGRPTACADHTQDANLAAAAMGLPPSGGSWLPAGLVCIR